MWRSRTSSAPMARRWASRVSRTRRRRVRTSSTCPPPAVAAAGPRGDLRRRSAHKAGPRHGQVAARCRAHVRPAGAPRSRHRRLPGDRRAGAGGHGLGRRGRGGADPVRRRQLRGRRRRAEGRRRLRGNDHAVHGAHGRRGRGGPDVPGRAHPGRHAGAGPGGGAEAPRAHPAPFPAELPDGDGRRHDRDPLRRPFRHALYPYRRFRGVAAHGDAGRRHGEPPPARQRRRAEPGPLRDRLGRVGRRHHRGLAAAAGQAGPSRQCRGGVRRFPRGGWRPCGRSRSRA